MLYFIELELLKEYIRLKNTIYFKTKGEAMKEKV